MSIALAYFEMIEQFALSEPSDKQSAKLSRTVCKRVYPTLPVSDDDVTRIYKCFRNGMYHSAMPKERCGLSRELDGEIANENGVIVINPARLVADLVSHFRVFCAGLRAPADGGDPRNFECMFDSFISATTGAAHADTKTTPAPWDMSSA